MEAENQPQQDAHNSMDEELDESGSCKSLEPNSEENGPFSTMPASIRNLTIVQSVQNLSDMSSSTLDKSLVNRLLRSQSLQCIFIYLDQNEAVKLQALNRFMY